MKVLKPGILTLFVLLILLTGIVLISGWIQWPISGEHIKNSASYLVDSPWGLLIGIILVIASIVFVTLNLRDRRLEQFFGFDNPEGEVAISIHAIEDFVRKIGREAAEVRDATPIIRAENDGNVEIDLKLKLCSSTSNIPQLADAIQKDVKHRVQNVLGIDNITSVRIILEKDSFAAKEPETIKESSPAPAPASDSEFIP